MTSKSFARLLALLLMVLAGQPDRSANAGQIEFSATIFQSPFASGDLAVSGTITGWFTYDSHALPFETGSNYAKYRVLTQSITSGPTTFFPQFSEIGASHYTRDVYAIFWTGIIMPPIQGFSPAAIYLDLIDTDASVYTNGAYPVDLPDVSLFEIKQFSILFTDASMQHRFLIATIDSISLVPEPGTLSLVALAGFLVTGFGAINRRRSVGMPQRQQFRRYLW